MIKSFFNKLISLCLILSTLLCSCSPSLSGSGSVRNDQLMTESERMINEHYEDVRSILIEEGEYSEDELLSYGKLDGETVTRNLASSSSGLSYMNFLYQTEKAERVDEILLAARPLLDEENYKYVEEKALEIEERTLRYAERYSRSLNPNQKEEFYNDLRSFAVKSVVLFTAAVVYAIIPKTMFWGKVSAATAISVAAGIVASTLVTIIEWADKDTNLNTNEDTTAFESWLDNVTKEPVAAWALANGVITTQEAIGTSPVVAALILAVFAIYNITDGTKKLLKEYNWKL